MNDIITKLKSIIEQYKPYSFIVLAVIGWILIKKLMPKPRRKKRVVKPVVRVRTGRRKIKSVRKNTGTKKPWQIKGSPAARAHMKRLRQMRRK